MKFQIKSNTLPNAFIVYNVVYNFNTSMDNSNNTTVSMINQMLLCIFMIQTTFSYIILRRYPKINILYRVTDIHNIEVKSIKPNN